MTDEVFDIKSIKLAHPGKRYQGQFIDAIITVVIFILVLKLKTHFGFSGTLSNTAVILIPFIYFVFADALPNGQSLGKIPLGICVVSKTTGKPCTLIQSFARNAFTPLLGIIDAIAIFGAERQRLGDFFADTIVIEKKR